MIHVLLNPLSNNKKGQNAELELKKIFVNWNKKKQEYKILFLDASEKIIVGRYKATKRKHPYVVADSTRQ